jgi:ABC-type transport system involved in multi-copper enzyme maturation permease subunit
MDRHSGETVSSQPVYGERKGLTTTYTKEYIMILSQISGITYYEFRMHWRRRGLLVITLSMLAVLTLPVLLTRGEMMSRIALDKDGIDYYTRNIVLFHWSTVGVVLFAVVPFLFADAIPRDRQLGVSELLETTPLTRYAYLIGKIAGAWLCTLSGVLLTVFVSCVVWSVLVAPFNLSIYLPVWFLGALPMILINVGIIVPLTAGISNGRLAVMVCIGFVILIPLAVGLNGRGDLIEALNPLRPGIFYHFLPLAWSKPSDSLSLEWTILLGLLQVAAISVGMWVWLRLRDER